MGSCFSCESRSHLCKSPAGIMRRRRSSRKPVSPTSSLDDFRREEQLHRDPNRWFLNGSTEIASLFTQQGHKGINQDAMIVWENFGPRTDMVFCGVFDGHGPYGHLVAKKVRDSLPLKLSAQLEVDTSTEDCSFVSANEEARAFISPEETREHAEVSQALKKTFLKAFNIMDRELRMYSNIDCFVSGTTAVTMMKQGQDVVIGNVGDSRAILGTRDENNSLIAVQLTVDLKPNLPAEKARIRKCKGRVFALRDEPEVARVWLPNNDSPGLAMARAFGDFCLKEFGVISVPDIFYRRIVDEDEFIVLATDGIWDVLSNEEVVEIVSCCPARSCAARTLVETAAEAWVSKYPTSRVDDCAAVCLFLNTSDLPVSSTYSEPCIPSPEQDEQDAAKVEYLGFDRSSTLRTGNNALGESKNGG